MEDFCESCNLNSTNTTPEVSSVKSNNFILYSTGCPKCKVVEMKLKQAGIEFEVISDIDEVVTFGKLHGIMSAPILAIGDKVFDFTAAVSYLREIK